MARAISWPGVVPPVAQEAAPPTTLLEDLDGAGFCAALGPELSRLFGMRIGARAAGDRAPGRQLGVGRIRVSGPAGPMPLDIALEASAAGVLVERLFGGRPADGSAGTESLASLPPGSGSWVSLCRFLTTSTTRALASLGHAPAGPAALPPRAFEAGGPPGATQLALALDIDGLRAGFVLIDPTDPNPVPEPEPEVARDMALWRRRAHARTLALDLPVTLRLAETRMAVSNVAALRVGDVIPLEPPRTLGVLVSGRRLADVPAERLLGNIPSQGSSGRRPADPGEADR